MSVPVQHPMYIDGQFVTWHDDAWIDVVNPATEEVISRIPDGVPKMRVKRSMPHSALSRNGRRCPPLSGQTGYARFLRVFASEPVKSVH